MVSALSLLVPLLLALTLLGIAGLRRVPSGRAVTVHRQGRYVRTLMPGLHWVLPGIDRIACEVALIGHHLTLPTRSLGEATARTDLYFQILEPLTVGERLEQVDDLVHSQANQALDAFEAEATPLSSGLAAAAESLKAELNRRTALEGVRIIRCSISASP